MIQSCAFVTRTNSKYYNDDREMQCEDVQAIADPEDIDTEDARLIIVSRKISSKEATRARLIAFVANPNDSEGLAYRRGAACIVKSHWMKVERTWENVFLV